jgi:hypothetical protein
MKPTDVFRIAGITLAWALLSWGGQNAGELAEKPRQAASENNACLVCHSNFRVEKLALKHAQAGVACAHCHGRSIEHCGNEENIIPPQIMYPKEKINSSCKKCHATHKAALTGSPSKICTDCHGKHRLSFRTKVWDKVTGKLLTSK